MIKGLPVNKKTGPWIRRVFTGRNAIFMLVAAIAFAALNLYRMNDPLPVGSKIEGFELTNINGDKFNISDIKTPVVLVFYKKYAFFSNYAFNNYYRRRLPELKFLQDKNYAQSIVLIEDIDSTESLKKAALDKNHKVLADIGYAADTKAIAKAFGVRSWPHLFVINSAGVIIFEAKLVSSNHIKDILWRD